MSFSYKSSKIYIHVEWLLLHEWFPQYDWCSSKKICSRKKPRTIYHWSFKHFIGSDFRDDNECALFHVMDIFDDIDNMARYTSFFLLNMSLTTTLRSRAKLSHHNQFLTWILLLEKTGIRETWCETNPRNIENLTGRKTDASETKLLKFKKLYG